MPVPKRKRSRARRDSRFANKGVKPSSISECSNCSTPSITHSICAGCGFYGGKKVAVTKKDRTVHRTEVRAEQAKRAKERQATQPAE